MYFFPWVWLGQFMKHWSVVQEEGLDSAGSPLSLSGLKNLGDGVSIKPDQCILLLLLPLDDPLWFPQKNYDCPLYRFPCGYYVFLLSLCLLILSSAVSQRGLSVTQCPRLQFCHHPVTRLLSPLIFRYACGKARHSPEWRESLVFLSLAPACFVHSCAQL